MLTQHLVTCALGGGFGVVLYAVFWIVLPAPPRRTWLHRIRDQLNRCVAEMLRVCMCVCVCVCMLCVCLI